jgi:hypothetical protein
MSWRKSCVLNCEQLTRYLPSKIFSAVCFRSCSTAGCLLACSVAASFLVLAFQPLPFLGCFCRTGEVGSNRGGRMKGAWKLYEVLLTSKHVIKHE